MGWASCLILVALSVGAIYQAIASNVAETRYKPPGRLVNIGGRRLHLHRIGDGSPTVIFEAALGWGMGSWQKVPQGLAETTQVCSYDRAGCGWSDVGPSPRASSQVSRDLHMLLEKAGVKSPLVLVGLSLGGLYVQHYAATYPEDVSGMVLVESSHEEARVEPSRLFVVAMRVLTVTGFGRLFVRFDDPSMKAVYSSNKTFATGFEELYGFAESARELRQAHLSLGNKPLIVLTAARMDDDAEWHRMQLDLATRSTNATRVVVKDSGHNVVNDRPDAVIAAIHDVVEKCRNP